MEDAKRYMVCGGKLHEAPGGTWVAACDYDRLTDRVAEQDAEIAALREERGRFFDIVDGLLHRLDGLVNRTDPHNGIRWASGHAYVVMKKLRDDLRAAIDEAREKES